jgi:hypothetical protein
MAEHDASVAGGHHSGGADERLSEGMVPIFFGKSQKCYCGPAPTSYNICICIICRSRLGRYNAGICSEGIRGRHAAIRLLVRLSADP